MNKKAQTEFPWKIMIVLGILLIWTIAGMIVNFDSPERNKVCKEIGFEEYSRWNNAEICKDLEGDYHYVEIKCDWKFIPIMGDGNCKAKEIKIGKVFGDKR